MSQRRLKIAGIPAKNADRKEPPHSGAAQLKKHLAVPMCQLGCACFYVPASNIEGYARSCTKAMNSFTSEISGTLATNISSPMTAR